MVFNSFLEVPSSAHVAALGGHNVSYVGDDPMFTPEDFAITLSDITHKLKVADGRAADFTIRLAEKFAENVKYIASKYNNTILQNLQKFKLY